MEDLQTAARELFDLEVETRLPISESFSSDVLLFVAADGERYVVKRPYAPNKAVREADALQALREHPGVPVLHGVAEHDGAVFLLIEGLDGTPWSVDATTSPTLLRNLGQSMRQIHEIEAVDFHGRATWHGLLQTNADKYLADIGPDDQALASAARQQLERSLVEVPRPTMACPVHFDLRPGNILTNDGNLVGIIDFEGCRGGHASMDFFKLWEQVAPVVPDAVATILEGYLDSDSPAEAWMTVDQLERLMQIYATYHGLAGLAWCYLRNDFTGDFPSVNRARMATLTFET